MRASRSCGCASRAAPRPRASRHRAAAAAAAAAAPAPRSPRLEGDPRALAYLGDAIWTLHVRRHFLEPPQHWRSYQAAVRPLMAAEGQAGQYDALLAAAAPATAAERDFLCAARAAAAGGPQRLRRRFAAHSSAAEAYHKATAFEALVGWLHLHDPQRLEQLVAGLLLATLGPLDGSGD